MLLTTIAASACTAQGSPSPSAGRDNNPAPGSSAAKLPPRPKDIPATSIDACKVFGKDQLKTLGLDSEPRKATNGADRFGNQGCIVSKVGGDPYFNYLVIPVPQEGVDAWLKGDRDSDIKQVTVSGFGAVRAHPNGTSGLACSVVVDIADGQSLNVQFTAGTPKSFDQEQLCDRARQGAELAMRTLTQG
ncbi:DUF3558 domain-containing protein [Streptoalloteichus tenebrarius]|uniref:DUF3558 domain-containing protein n=1 Tax=Streptoalloteichus tenebrarius (strain ATCC 17920 / DSM 40477 / JCM 4838 / CBS 697.72 / NBRC 16177 / NCIMB 11028 / NRRL B-12390 / A12253. 1 / ISP 5477) TaxID=1933 RepID=UPI0020A236B9|nr:DUF3558 domain-containing protein [Streptoalloteichus tenebrarius]